MNDGDAFDCISINLPVERADWVRERAAENGESIDIFLERILSLENGRRLVLSTGEKLSWRRTLYRD